jgi:undecaprenyl-diphosphatase
MESLKQLYGRNRPTVVPHEMLEKSLSLPSGHAMMSTVVFFTLAGVYARRSSNRKVAIFGFTLAAVFALAIGYSRIYLGVHHPSDVLAGWLMGLAWTLAMSIIAKKLKVIG